MAAPSLVLHVLPPSHPCLTARAALRFKGLQYERVDLPLGQHTEPMAELYGADCTTVPGMLVDGEPVHGSRAILARLELIQPEPSLFPAAIAEAVREAERWGDEEFQPLGRQLPWGALHFRPEALGILAGASCRMEIPRADRRRVGGSTPAFARHARSHRRPDRRRNSRRR